MMPGFKFEKLIIWQQSMEFGEVINALAHTFPKDELYNLSSQIRRAVDSIALNISEGSIGQSNSELTEVVTCLHKARKRTYISEEEFLNNYESAYNLMNMMIAFKEKIK